MMDLASARTRDAVGVAAQAEDPAGGSRSPDGLRSAAESDPASRPPPRPMGPARDAVLAVCYSYTGTARTLAQLLCSHHGWPLGEVVEVHRRAGAIGTLRCIIDSLLRRRPAFRYDGPDPADFHTVVLLSPIWMYRLAGPMRSFVAARREALQHVAVIFTMGFGGASNAVAEIAHALGRAPVLVGTFTQQEVENGEGTSRLLALGDELLSPPARQKRDYARTGAPAEFTEQ